MDAWVSKVKCETMGLALLSETARYRTKDNIIIRKAYCMNILVVNDGLVKYWHV